MRRDGVIESVWIGARRASADDPAGYRWSHGVELRRTAGDVMGNTETEGDGKKHYPMWLNRTHVPVPEGGADCVALERVYHDRPVFVDLQCQIDRPFVCERDAQLEEKVSELKVVRCRTGLYHIYGGRMDWHQAAAYCALNKMSLANIGTMHCLKKLGMSMLKTRPSIENAWIGAKGILGKWSWVDSGLNIFQRPNFADTMQDELWPPMRDRNTVKQNGCLQLDRHATHPPVFMEARCERKMQFICYQGEEAPSGELAELVRHCEQTDKALIIGTDSNAHHQLWGMTKSNKRGEELVDYLFTTNLNIINTGSEPTFVTRRGRSIIDLTLASRRAADLISDWHVSPEASCSDHRWIRFNIAVQRVTQPPRRIPSKTNRSQYRRQVTRSLRHLQSGSLDETYKIDETAEELTRVIISSYQTACPLSTPSSNSGASQSWWGPELEKLRKKVRRLFNRAMNTCDDQDWDAYKDAKALYKRRIRHWSNGSWRKFCSDIDSCTKANKVRKLLSKDRQQDLAQLRKADGSLTETTEEAQRVLLETHFPGCIIHTTHTWNDTSWTPTEQSWNTALKTVSTDKLRWAINSFQPFKAAGPDGIFPALLQWAGEALILILVPLLRACLAFRYTPKLWREVKVIFIPKPGKADYNEAKSFRPISLSSFLLKTLERLCDRELRDNQLVNVPLHPNQHAYSPGKSTESALHAVVSKIEDSLRRKELCLGTFIDIEGAFDKTSFASIVDALGKHGVDETIIYWVSNMLRNRLIRLQDDNHLRALATKGCPQGGVLSPLLWNVVVNDLITKLNNLHYHTVGYADDLAIIIPGKFASTACDVMRGAMKVVEKWCDDYGLKVNPVKTELVMFTNKRSLGDYRLPKLFNTTLRLSNEVKYLGITLDSKLNWGSHIDKTTTKTNIIFWQCRKMISKTWGLSPLIVKWLYTTIIRPIISYAAVVWWTKTIQVTTINKLRRLQRRACCAITGCMKTTPTSALETILNVRPLHLFIQQEAACTATRLSMLGHWRDNNSPHTSILADIHRHFPYFAAVNDLIPKTYVFDKKYKIQLYEDTPDRCLHKELRVYTDGSKTNCGTGSGVFSEDLNIHISTALGAYNTVFQAECVGIIRAAEAIECRGVRGKHIRILSDSASVLQALDNNIMTSGLIYECHSKLTNIANDNRLTLQWIKGHSGSRGNDAADCLAREGSSRTAIGPEPIIPIPYRQLRTWIRERSQRQHDDYWSKLTDCRQAREAVPKVNLQLTRKLIRLPRQALKQIVGILTGHGYFNKHLCNIGISDSPLCRACLEADETSAHVLLECRGVARQRTSLMGSPKTIVEACSNIRGLLSFLEELGWQD
ncbi:hypothetical protein evm_013751 [Chilo suppressalis]|nr:hypothetical protein evm_013751 [Chilo suppressalis]